MTRQKFLADFKQPSYRPAKLRASAGCVSLVPDGVMPDPAASIVHESNHSTTVFLGYARSSNK
jgi:hypothetical protein